MNKVEKENNILVCDYCGDYRIKRNKNGSTKCITGCYNTDIISWTDYCNKMRRAIEYAFRTTGDNMREQYGIRYNDLIIKENNVTRYTNVGQNIFDDTYDDLYHEYMVLN